MKQGIDTAGEFVSMALDSASDLSAFHQFVVGQLQGPGNLRAPEECLEIWRALHPQSDELTSSTEALRQVLSDMRVGDNGCSARGVLNQARQKYNAGS